MQSKLTAKDSGSKDRSRHPSSSIIAPTENSTQKLAPKFLQPGMRAWRAPRLVTRPLQTTGNRSVTVQRLSLRGFRSSPNVRPSLLLQPEEGSTIRNTGTGPAEELQPPPRNPFCFVCGRAMRMSSLTVFAHCSSSTPVRSLLLHLVFSLIVSISPDARQGALATSTRRALLTP